MARYVTPFVVFNLGAEMVFVVAQRLSAQKVPHEKSTFVLDEIISVLISPQLVSEITKPQAAYSRKATKNLIEDVTQSSAMRLDPNSMDKLWDLITMVFKWQATLATDLIKLTQRHLYEVESFVTSEETHLQLHKVQNLVDNYTKILSPIEKLELRDQVLYWLRDFNVRVSLLLRMGLQDINGNFVTEDLDPFSQEMLRNLGENIYSVTRNGEVMEERKQVEQRIVNSQRNNDQEAMKSSVSNGVELHLLADQLLGEGNRKSNLESAGNVLKLTISNCDNTLKGGEIASKMECLELMHDDGVNKNDIMSDLFDEMSLHDCQVSDRDFQEELLNIISSE